MKYRCRYCKGQFEMHELQRMMPQVCKGRECLSKYFDEYGERVIRQARAKLARERRAEKREAKEKLKTHGEWLNDLQKVFNAYIRKRDESEPCISCGNFSESYDAGHYWSVGGYSGLRFEAANNHKQCTRCNQHLHGNIAEYTPRLIAKIGQAEFERLKSERHRELKLSIPEIKGLIEKYKAKLKTMTQ